MVLRSEDGDWVWAFGLYPSPDGGTVLVSRNRITTPGANNALRAFNVLVMEPGSLVMERKMLLGIKQRAERLARSEHDQRLSVVDLVDRGQLAEGRAPGPPPQHQPGEEQGDARPHEHDGRECVQGR